MLTPEQLPRIQAAIAESGVDGWLIFDFHGLNPVAQGVLGLTGMATRRIFCYIPRAGNPVAITHAIEQGPWREWPPQWDRRVYSGWRTLEAELARTVGGRRVAMEYSPGDAVPYLDRVPAGVVEMVRAAGASVHSSAELVTRFHAVWSAEQLGSHERAARVIATIARDAIVLAGECAANAEPTTEYALLTWIRERFDRAGLVTDHGPIVAIGPSAADPHYEPSATSSPVIDWDDILLIDLWARERDGVFADQTWMGSLGVPGERDVEVWEAIRDARDAAISLLGERVAANHAVRGGEVDDAARQLIELRGYGEQFIHRTGHSIDPHDLHGSGPHIDNLETRDERLLLQGVGFSIEPGIYIPGEVGMRTEVNAYVGDGRVVVTPADYQRDLIIV